VRLRQQYPLWRICACAHLEYILYFLDTTRNGTRRWCDMRTCGNRAKAQRYQRRHRAPQ
jgi:predicted RNA-binding Zn ribbon-like protein